MPAESVVCERASRTSQKRPPRVRVPVRIRTIVPRQLPASVLRGTSVNRPLAALSIAFLLLSPLAARAAAPDTLADGTRIERWTLANGMKVVTRSAPGAGAVAITLGYRMGIDDDPAGRSGLAQLLGDLTFTSAAGNQPDRTPEELDSQRPLGWSYAVLRHMTLATEVATY